MMTCENFIKNYGISFGDYCKTCGFSKQLHPKPAPTPVAGPFEVKWAVLPSKSRTDREYHFVKSPKGWRHVHVGPEECEGDFYRGWCWHTDFLNFTWGFPMTEEAVQRMVDCRNDRLTNFKYRS